MCVFITLQHVIASISVGIVITVGQFLICFFYAVVSFSPSSLTRPDDIKSSLTDVVMAFISRSVLWFSMLSLVHCGLSAAQHKSYLRLSEQGSSFVPADIIMQTLISLLIAMWATLRVAGEFREVRAAAQLENKTFETAANCPNFYTFPRQRGEKFVKDLIVYE